MRSIKRRVEDDSEYDSESDFNKDDYVDKKQFLLWQTQIKEEIRQAKAQSLELRNKAWEDRAYVEKSANDGLALLKQELMGELIMRDDKIQSTQEDMMLSRKKLSNETSDFQIQFNVLKGSIQDVFNSYDAQVDDIRYLKNWSYKLNELMQL